MEVLLTMSKKEVDRFSIIDQLIKKKLSSKQSSVLLGISERQLFRILSRVRQEGSKGIIHKLRGKRSNRGYSEDFKKK